MTTDTHPTTIGALRREVTDLSGLAQDHITWEDAQPIAYAGHVAAGGGSDLYLTYDQQVGGVAVLTINAQTPPSYLTPDDDDEHHIAILNILGALWAYDGEAGPGNTDLTATIRQLADALDWEGQLLRNQIIDMLSEASHTHMPSSTREYNTELQDGGIVDIDGEQVAWWHNGAETRWMYLSDADDDTRTMVGAPDA